MTSGELGGWIGGAIGVAGGILGSYCSIRNAPPGPPRRFMVRACVASCVVLAVFLALFLWCRWAAPSSRWMLWIIYFPTLFVGIHAINKRYSTLLSESKDGRAAANDNNSPDSGS